MAPIVGPAGPQAVAKPGEVAIVGRRLPPAYRAKAPWPAAGAGPKHNQSVRRSSDQPLSITTGRGPKLPVGPPTPRLTRGYVIRLGPDLSPKRLACNLRAIVNPQGALFAD